MRKFSCLLACSLAIGLSAQDDPRLYKPVTKVPVTRSMTSAVPTPSTNVQKGDSLPPGKVVVLESAKISAQMANYAATTQPLDGYRVQIFNGDRNTAETIRRNFMIGHPEVPAYLSYLAPNFRVRVGDLRDRVTAEKMREDLRTEFPGLYVVPEQIALPGLP